MSSLGHKPHSLEYFPLHVRSRGFLIHYTCNAPSFQVLKKYKIKSRGDEFGC